MFRTRFSGKLLVINNKLNVGIRDASSNIGEKQEFTRLQLIRKQEPRRRGPPKGQVKTELSQPRYKEMPVDQNWSSVWPTAQSFRPSVVPLPLFQGYTVKKKSPPNKFVNAELMKIPNFLHLTPPAIDAHCQAIKKFCTPWPMELKTDQDCHKNFPLEVVSSDYIYTGPSLRDARSRVVTIKFKLEKLNLDYRSRDKFIRLVGDRYDGDNDTVTIVADRCPLKKQNYDYAIYVLTALYHESKNKEDWEAEKTEDDMEAFFFDQSRSQNKIKKTLQAIRGDTSGDDSDDIQKYGADLEILINDGETDVTLQSYKKNALQILGLKQNPNFKPSEE